MMDIQRIKASKEFKQFESVFANGKMVHAYLVYGENEESNRHFCLAMAQKLVCVSHNLCGVCPGCKKIEAGFHPDVFAYPLGKSFLVADSEDILENVAIKPLESQYKIFLINQFDKATVQAQNKLLKNVEEAPNNVVFIFNAVNINNVLQTIKSRTQEIEIPNFNLVNLAEKDDYVFLKDMVENLASSKQTLKYVAKFADKKGFEERLKTLAEIFEEILMQQCSQNSLGKYQGQALTYSTGAIAEILGYITIAKRQFLANVSTNLITDNLLLKILEVRYKWNNKT